MRSSQVFCHLEETALLLNFSEAEILALEVEGKIGFQISGDVKEYALDYNPEGTPKYTLARNRRSIPAVPEGLESSS